MTAAISTAAPNSYYRCLSYHSAPVGWDPYAEPEKPDYFTRVLRAMDQHLGDAGLTIYQTWRLDALPSYGSDVVAVVMGDEWGQVPAYANRVLATFKCYGSRPALAARPARHPSYVNALALVKYAFLVGRALPRVVKHQAERARMWVQGRVPPPLYPVPLGYGNQLDLRVRPLSERNYDLFFAGSLSHAPKQTHKLQSPKEVSRARMMETVRHLSRVYPELRIKLHTNERFVLNAIEYGLVEPGEVMDAEAYSRTLMDSRICLAPRGTSPETFRFFEGLRYGCVVITERLPSRWFYDGAPVLQVDDWSEVQELVPRLLADPAWMGCLHAAAQQWWRSKCSEEAVGAFMAARIRQRLCSQNCGIIGAA